MEPIRILHCPIGNMNVGGIENMIMQIYRNIDRSQVQFDFVVHGLEENYYEKEIVDLGGRIYKIPYISRNPIRHIVEFKRILQSHPEYKIVHIHTTYAVMYYDALIAKKLNRMVIVHSHNSSATKVHTLFHKFYRGKLSDIADYRIACSYIAGNWMFRENAPFDVWKNAINLDKFKFDNNIRKRVRFELGLSDQDVLVGNVSRLTYQKNQSLLIDVYREYCIKNPNSKLILVGDGEDREMLQKKVEKLGLSDKVVFTGNKSNVNEYLMAMDIFCLTSRWEGFGVAMIEAQTTGTTTIASKLVADQLVKELKYISFIEDYDCVQSWCKEIMHVRRLTCEERESCYSQMVDLGYSIGEAAKQIEKFYLEKWN